MIQAAQTEVAFRISNGRTGEHLDVDEFMNLRGGLKGAFTEPC